MFKYQIHALAMGKLGLGRPFRLLFLLIILGCLAAGLIYSVVSSFTLSPKGAKPIMSSIPLPIESRLTPQQSLLTDEIGNEVYASHYSERRLSRFIIGTETVLLLGAFGLIFSLAHRPIANRYIRIDEMGRAQAIAYSDLNYSPREGEVRTYLTDWAELPVYGQPGHHRQEVSAQLLLPVAELGFGS